MAAHIVWSLYYFKQVFSNRSRLTIIIIVCLRCFARFSENILYRKPLKCPFIYENRLKGTSRTYGIILAIGEVKSNDHQQ